MSTVLIDTRRAKPSDAGAVAQCHDEAWRTAYQGIIPGPELEKLIARRGPAWWNTAIRKGSLIRVLQFGDKIAGYANYGHNRARSLREYDFEIYELYLRPEFQGLGFGRRLFNDAWRDLARNDLARNDLARNKARACSLIVWALSENDSAVQFYRALDGRAVARSKETFGSREPDKIAFGWAAKA
jgi:ribosomal protein S18 acetylase RimI-like enzyme